MLMNQNGWILAGLLLAALLLALSSIFYPFVQLHREKEMSFFARARIANQENALRPPAAFFLSFLWSGVIRCGVLHLCEQISVGYHHTAESVSGTTFALHQLSSYSR